MALALHATSEPHSKRQKLNESHYIIPDDFKESITQPYKLLKPTKLPGSDPTVLQTELESFSRSPSASNYIPAGSIRVYREDVNISQDLWLSCNQWAVHKASNDFTDHTAHRLLPILVKEALMRNRALSMLEILIRWGLVCAEFKSNDAHHGQYRIYLLNGHMSRRESLVAEHDKSMRKAYKQLFRSLDTSRLAWEGKWTSGINAEYISAPKNLESDYEDKTLLSLFNDLPSPKPSHDTVDCEYVRCAMINLLDGNVTGLQTKMYPYQRRSAAVMVQREIEPGLLIDPRLKKLLDQNGVPWYCDPDDNYYSQTPRMYDAPRGGILAENMGLGKTLICLGLILSTRAQSATAPPEHSLDRLPVRRVTGSLLEMAGAAMGRHAVPWKDEFMLAAKEGIELRRAEAAIKSQPGHYFVQSTTAARASRRLSVSPPPQKVLLSTTTLVVVPTNLLQQWINEINKHTKSLRVLVMKEMAKEIPIDTDIIEFDVMLFTKSRFDKEARSGRLENSPLRTVHFKRLIYDEGHTFGSASSSSPTESFMLINSLHISARWIVSGTPSQGLYSTDTEEFASTSPAESISSRSSTTDRSTTDPRTDTLAVAQERKDLLRLGNIAMHFLKARPWSPSPDNDVATWQYYALQPRHGEKSRGNMECLRKTLEGMMLRHQLSDVGADVELPPLYEDIVYLEPCLQNKIMLNTFALMVITNAVTSERKDDDYFFHPKQRKHLLSLVSNLRQGSFFWSGFEKEHILKTVSIGEDFLTDKKVPTSAQDVVLLEQAIKYGKNIAANHIFQIISANHEIPMHLNNEWPSVLRGALSLDDLSSNPTLFSAPMLFDAQKYMHKTENPTPQKMVIAAHQTCLRSEMAELAKMKSKKKQAPNNERAETRNADVAKKASNLGPKLAGAVSAGQDYAPKKLSHASGKDPHISLLDKNKMKALQEFEISLLPEQFTEGESFDENTFTKTPDENVTASVVEAKVEVNKQLSAKLRDLLDTTTMITTASTKLSYLLDRIVQYQNAEKIIVFYEDSNVAWYIAQYLECLNIKHLIYATELKSDVRSRYVATFNTTESFRVLLMDVSQAAFGLDISSASRVYFINPVFSPQVEAQAVKRAHRIGQTKPVFVETLVLKGSIEEAVVARRNAVSKEEHQKMKTLLDDETLYDWIRSIQLIPMDLGDVPAVDQMAALAVPQAVFGQGFGHHADANPLADIVQVDSVA